MRDLPVGNGRLLVNFDDKYQIRDIYYPHVGQENHTDGFPCRFGIWADGLFSWIHDDGWTRELRYADGSAATDVRLMNGSLGIVIECSDLVAEDRDIYMRRIGVRDLIGSRELRVFLHHDLRIYENKIGDTAYYDPETRSLIHYKKHRYFLIDTLPHFDQFATGRKAFRHMEGTWRDAEDGELHGGVITEGSVDSTIAIHGRGDLEFYCWIAAGTSRSEVADLANFVKERSPSGFFSSVHSTASSIGHPNGLSSSAVELFERSLLIIPTQIDRGGAVIAANDHDVTERATDHYSYLWPRDGAFVVNALDLAGHPEYARRFFSLCSRIVDRRGYFLQKYSPDGSVGSGWHPFWDRSKAREMLPIQEDETALVLWALGEHFAMHPDRDLLHSLYAPLILKCATFLANCRDSRTGLPLPSWNLWEDRRGVHTFTCSTVVAGLRAAAQIAEDFGDVAIADEYRAAANEVVAAMREHLFDPGHDRFVRSLEANSDDRLTPDLTVDASLFGVFYFGCFAVDDPMVVSTMQAVEDHLRDRKFAGGVARFSGDGYMLESQDIAGNSWIICTLWLAEYKIATGDAAGAAELIDWVARQALPSGVLPEQIDPVTGKHLSVSPLTWSHSTFVATVLRYSAAFGSKAVI